MMSITYIAQVVPAPAGWQAVGMPIQGQEFYYVSSNGLVQIFPAENGGWEIQSEGAATTDYADTPQAAFDFCAKRWANVLRVEM